MMKKLLCVLLVVILCLGITGCSTTQKEISTVYADKDYGFQMEKPQVGDTIAVMHTSKGDISIRLFPEAAPKAVQNFTTHAKDGYYDGLTFHRVIDDFMIQGGDPEGTGAGGKSIWGNTFEDEFDQKLLNIRGALSMANSGVNTNGSQFFIVQADAETFGTREDYEYSRADVEAQALQFYTQMVSYYGEDTVKAYYGTAEQFIESSIPPYEYDAIPDAVWDLYEKQGGSISLDGAWRRSGGHTVFGHVFEGMDIVDAIAAVETDDSDKPKEDVIINSIEIKEYQG